MAEGFAEKEPGEKEVGMIITVHMLDGRKITQEKDKLLFFSPTMCKRSDVEYPDLLGTDKVPDLREGHITINLDNVLYMHEPDEDELKYLENHGL